MEQSHPGAIPGDEASSIGVRFEAMPNGEIHVSEVSFARVALIVLVCTNNTSPLSRGVRRGHLEHEHHERLRRHFELGPMEVHVCEQAR
jgi:hypothetical protein